MKTEAEYFDVLVVGAGLSGISAACHLRERCPERSLAILEAREASGGTWDLFRYPGIRSDSDMYTLGYRFRPWTAHKAIADGNDILSYVRETAREHGVDGLIRYRQAVKAARWNSEQARWQVEVETAEGTRHYHCQFLHLCCGYYDYSGGYTPDFPGRGEFRGRVVHPQQWPEGLDWSGQQVVVIGSGATAVTLVPALAEQAAKVTMLQRSPSYVMSLPASDPIANFLRRLLPARAAYAITRWKNVLLGQLLFTVCRRAPQFAARLIRAGVKMQLRDETLVDAHFKPRYAPWDQRLCLVPNGDLFRAIRKGQAEVVTDEIERFTASGIRLKSGRELTADLIITATGLRLLPIGGLKLEVDGQPVQLPNTLSYKGMMLSGVPNLALALGYTNASWTLKCDLVCEYVCRLLNELRDSGQRVCVPVNRDPALKTEPIIDFSSGYVLRALEQLPKQGTRAPWRLRQNYLLDLLALRYGRVRDGVMQFR